MSGGGSEDTTWPGLSGLFRNAFREIWALEHLQFYVCQSGGREGEWTGGRARGRSGWACAEWMDGREGERAGGRVDGRASGRAGGRVGGPVGRNILIYDKWL